MWDTDFKQRALTQSVGRNDTSHDGRVYCGGVPRIRGTVRRLFGPLRFDQCVVCTCRKNREIAMEAFFLWDTDFKNGL